ncbi:MAG: CHAP domain-containing protein [Gordonia sp. (in: high G+C Gram-positive bacteria)]
MITPTKRIVSAALTLAAAAGLSAAIAAPPAEAGIKTAKTLETLNVRSQPNSSGRLLRRIPGGTAVGINCWTNGQAVTGRYGRTTIWYTIDGGGWVTDAGLYTGTNNPVTPRCGTTTPAPAPTNGRAVGAKSSHNSGTYGYCTWGALELWRQNTGYYPRISGNAKDYAASARANGWTVVSDAQPRSIVVFAPGVHGVDRTYGHVGWVTSVEQRSDGRYIHYRDMNGRAGYGQWGSTVTKDISGMSYILAP